MGNGGRQSSKELRKDYYRVHSSVTGVDGRRLPGVDVMLWWQRMRKRVGFGKARTSQAGQYKISYPLSGDAPGQLLIVVGARSKRLREPIETPATAAQDDLEINLSSEPLDISKFATLLAAIDAQLDRNVVENAHHHDISFLAQKTHQTTEQIMRAVMHVSAFHRY